jgi:hypothetical protein
MGHAEICGEEGVGNIPLGTYKKSVTGKICMRKLGVPRNEVNYFGSPIVDDDILPKCRPNERSVSGVQ